MDWMRALGEGCDSGSAAAAAAAAGPAGESSEGGCCGGSEKDPEFLKDAVPPADEETSECADDEVDESLRVSELRLGGAPPGTWGSGMAPPPLLEASMAMRSLRVVIFLDLGAVDIRS